MKFILEEVVRRLLNYLILVAKGNNREEKLEFLLKNCLLAVALSLIVTISVSSRYAVDKMYLADLERSITKLDIFMEKQQENMDQLYAINSDQYKTLIFLKKKSDGQLIDIHRLLKDKKLSEIENEELKKKIVELNRLITECQVRNKK